MGDVSGTFATDSAANARPGSCQGAVTQLQPGALSCDHRWHLATATTSTTAGMQLYVDGARVATDPTVMLSGSWPATGASGTTRPCHLRRSWRTSTRTSPEASTCDPSHDFRPTGPTRHTRKGTIDPMSVPINVLVSYLPVVLYLMVMTIAVVGLGRVPFWAHPALIVPGLVVRVLTTTDRSEVAVAAGIGALLFFGGVFFLARVVSGATLFTVVGAFTLAPLSWGYPGILAGLVVAGAYSAWRTARRLGGQHVRSAAWQTLFAFGVSPGGFRVPDPEAIPGKRAVLDGAAPDGAARDGAAPAGGVGGEDDSQPLSIQPFLLVGVLLAGTLHVLLA